MSVASALFTSRRRDPYDNAVVDHQTVVAGINIQYLEAATAGNVSQTTMPVTMLSAQLWRVLAEFSSERYEPS